MKNSKSTLVTVIIAVMLVVIDAGLYLIYKPGFMILSGVLAAYGYFRGAADFRRWLCKEPPLTPADLPDANGKFFDWEKEERNWDSKRGLAPATHEAEASDPLTDNQLLDAIMDELREAPAEA